jgi:glycosyltransferase involved in cell wall biosynthesis
MVKKIVLLVISCLTLTSIAREEKKFVIVITSYNNAEWFDRNLGCLFTQLNNDGTGLYENYRIIYIDDCSPDGTAELVEKYIISCNQQHRVTLIKNKTRKRAMANLYYALQLCQPDEIVFNYDGDDWLANNTVFALINDIYQNPDIWITYGQFQNWPTGQMGYCQPLSPELAQKQNFRKKWWKPGQLRTFYAWLFHQIHLKDLLFEGPYFQGQFFPANADLAVYYPMMEMAGSHYHFIPEVIYIRNVATPLNDFKANKEVQILGSKLLREKPKYSLLENPPAINCFENFKNQTSDLIVFTSRQDFTNRLIDSVNKLASHINKILTMESSETEFKKHLIDLIKSSPSNYILFAFDQMVFCKQVDCADAIYELEKAYAYGFYLGLGHERSLSYQTGITQPMPALNQITNSVYAWAFHYADCGDWRCCNNLGATIYRKEMVLEQLEKLFFSNAHELFEQWKSLPVSLEEVGLCYEQSKINYITWY